MPFGAVKLIPGVNVERTPTLNEAGVTASQLIRYKDALIQKYGGWSPYLSLSVTPTPRDLHGWQDLSGNGHLSVASTNGLTVVTSGAATIITPQTLISDFAPNFSTVINTPTVTVVDANISNVTSFDSIYFNTPVAVGGLILQGGPFPITPTGTHSYTFTMPSNATSTVNNGGVVPQFTTTTNSATVKVTLTAHGLTTGAMIFEKSTTGNGVTIAGNYTVTSVIDANNFNITVQSQANASGSFFMNGGNAEIVYYLNLGPTLPGQGYGLGAYGPATLVTNAPTAAGSTVLHFASVPPYVNNGTTTPPGVIPVTDVTTLGVISGTATISTTSPTTITITNAVLGGGVLNLDSIQIGTSSLYGFGTAGGSAQTGTPITATDWTQDNWGQILLSCPTTGGIYQYDPTGGFTNAGLIATAPPFNTGIFVSSAQQIVVAFGSTVNEAIGSVLDPLLVRWCTVGDFTNWTPTATNQAGQFRIPSGSKCVAGAAVAQQDLVWTDIDLWAMNYQGPPFVFGFNKIGAGAGAISLHAVQALRGNVYWMGPENFFQFNAGGVSVIPCPVWDFVFQNINTTHIGNVRAMPNTPFNECGWLFPSSASSSGECDSYVKMNITEQGAPWDFGPIARSAWMDQSALGMPISATPQGVIYTQETTFDAAGSALNASFTTGYFMIAPEGEDFAFVDLVLPDMKWGVYPGTGSATVLFTFYSVDFPGDTPRSYGPYSLTQGTEYINVRIRGRQMAIMVQSLDTGSFWRLGRIRYRWSPMGRR